MTNAEAVSLLMNISAYDIDNKRGMQKQEALEMAIKALEQTRPKGKWSRPSVVAMPYSFAYECPICKQWGNIQTFEPNYCPNCGARMEVEE